MLLNLFMDGTKLNRHLEEVVKWQRGEWFAPIHLELSLTNVCNQKCTFCYISWSHGGTHMSQKMTVDLIRSAKKTGVKSILIAGEGEPTANPAYVDAIEIAGEVGLDVALNTNAVLLSEDDLRRILPYLSWVRFSVQGSTKERYAAIHSCPEQHFEKAIENIRTAVKIKRELELDVTLGLQQVLIEENGDDTFATAQLAKEIGCDYYVIKPCHPHELNTEFTTIGNLVEIFRSNLEKIPKLSDDIFKGVVRWNFLDEAEQPRSYNKCLGLPFIVQITADGRVETCYPRSGEPGHEYGTLHDHSFEEIVTSSKFADVSNHVRDNVNVHECMPTCRQHNANKYLWWLDEEKPDHFNFI